MHLKSGTQPLAILCLETAVAVFRTIFILQYTVNPRYLKLAYLE